MITVKRIDPAALNLKEQVVSINRVTKVVKGGKNLSFSALVVIGDPSAKVVDTAWARPRKCLRRSARALRRLRRAYGAYTSGNDHRPHRDWGVRQFTGAAEAGSRRHGRDRGRRGARGSHGLRRAQCAHQVDRPAESSQCGEGDHRGARIAARSQRVAEMRGLAVEKL